MVEKDEGGMRVVRGPGRAAEFFHRLPRKKTPPGFEPGGMEKPYKNYRR